MYRRFKTQGLKLKTQDGHSIISHSSFAGEACYSPLKRGLGGFLTSPRSSKIISKTCLCIFLSLVLLQYAPSDAKAQTTNAVETAAISTSVRLKDIARISCAYDTQLYGYGLVVGLDGTGDSGSSTFTMQSVLNMMERFGISIPAGRLSVKNVAAVIVTAELPFLAKAGSRIDVLVSSLGDAKSIANGTLLPTPLCALSGEMYVLVQGPVSVGGYSVSAGGGNSVQKNHPTVGRVPNGGLITKTPQSSYSSEVIARSLQLVLNEPDFTTATRMVSAINAEFQNTAQSIDASSVKIVVPEAEKDVVAFLSRLENLTVTPANQAVIVINERTGTIVVGNQVRIAPVAVSHSNLTIQIKTEEEVSQPSPLSGGNTTVISKEDIDIQEENPKMQVIRGGASIDDVVRALNLIGIAPRDMIIILQAIKQAGALHAKLVIM